MLISKRLRAAMLAAFMLVSMILSACNNPSGDTDPSTQPTSAEISYTVAVKDARGNPYGADVIVRFLQNGKQAAMQVVGENGVAEKTLPRGEYTVELMFTDSDASYSYDTTNVTLTAQNPHLDIVLAQAISGEQEILWAGDKENIAYHVSTGSTLVSLTAGERNYFLFVPTESGTYEFTVSEGNAQLGYYGSPHFVQAFNIAEQMNGNSFTISVSAGMIGSEGGGTSVFVIGLDAAADTTSCYLNIMRIGDPQHTIADEPWIIYETSVNLSKYTLPENAALKDFDLTAATSEYKLVYNANDGFFHLGSENGPLVLARLGKNTAYLDSFKTILETSGVNCYFFNEDGSFQKKESYSDCLVNYLNYVDEKEGVYPLTKDLMYIFQNHGEYSGWWDPSDARYRFVDANGNRLPGINNEIAWLFLCCYIAQ